VVLYLVEWWRQAGDKCDRRPQFGLACSGVPSLPLSSSLAHRYIRVYIVYLGIR
jgi:hypothetical protein